METYGRFLYEFLGVFFEGFKLIFGGLFSGVIKMFNISEYANLISQYKQDFNVSEWVLVSLAISCLIIVLGLLAVIIILSIKKRLRNKKKYANQELMAQQIDNLNEQVEVLVDEKMKLMDLISPELGIGKNGERHGLDSKGSENNEDKDETEEEVSEMDSRFSKLTLVDKEFAKYKQKDYKNNFDLPEFCYRFRNFSGGRKKLYYSEKLIRLFVSALASTKLIILQGISGTGKTSICLAWGGFIKHFPCIAAVQPSWRDRTDIFGYFNEFTKKFNETDFLSYLYTAGYTDEIYTVVLDEMNLARVEYYFAEMLSILEMHDPRDWKIEIVQSIWPDDPKKLIKGKLQIPANSWYIGTINNDDSTFMVTDKVYDRAMPIDLNEKGTPFKADDVDAIDVNYSYLNGIFEQAYIDYAVSSEVNQKIEEMDNYTITHFRVAFRKSYCKTHEKICSCL